jgi:hypothetical protein
MKGDLIINGKDAYEEWGAEMGSGFLDAIAAPCPLKDPVKNEARTAHGVRTVQDEPLKDQRDLTLIFQISGATRDEFRTRKAAFFEELYKRRMTVEIPENGSEVYKLDYTGKSISYSQNTERTFCKIGVKFNEPNPDDR